MSKQNMNEEIMEAVMERPYGFSVRKRIMLRIVSIRPNKRFYLYPVTLGMSILLSRLMQELEINAKLFAVNPSFEALRVVHAHKDIACLIIAYSTAKCKHEAFDAREMQKRKSFFIKHLDNEEIAQLLLIIYQYDKTALFVKHLGLDREQKDQAKISKAKNKNGNTVTFGGRSLYGSLIGAACEKYGWTLDYVVWGISLVNLRMMLADSINSIYLSDEEKKAARLTAGQEIVNMDDPSNWAKIKAMKWD